MTIRANPTTASTMIGGTVDLPESTCDHEPARFVRPWTGEPGTAGTVTVVGAGKMGLPLAAQFASHGWHVIAVDINESVVAAINEGRAHVAEEPGLAERVAAAHAAGLLRATTDGGAAARDSDVVVLIVPVMLDARQQPDYRFMDAAVAAIAPGVTAGTVVVFETTLPVGDTRGRFLPMLEAATGLVPERDLFVAFSPERLYSGAVFRNLATYPKLVGGIGPASTDRASRFYASVLDAEVVAMSSAEAAELSKLAETTYRDVNIAFANELAAYASRVGVDVLEAIRAANSQPYSHIHQPGLGVGGHCIPVYPHFLLSRAPEMELVGLSRRVNDGQVDAAVGRLSRRARRPSGRARPRPWPDVPRGREGARVLAGDPAPRAAGRGRCPRRGVGSAAVRRGDRGAGGHGLDLGITERGARDRHPDGRSGVPAARPRVVPRPRGDRRRPEQPARPRACRPGVRVLGVGVPPRGGAPTAAGSRA